MWRQRTAASLERTVKVGPYRPKFSESSNSIDQEGRLARGARPDLGPTHHIIGTQGGLAALRRGTWPVRLTASSLECIMPSRARASVGERDQGFTLIELLVVIIIIGVLAAIAIPVFLSQRIRAYDGVVKSDLRNAALAEETYLTEQNTYTASVAALKVNGFKYSDPASYSAAPASIAITINSGISYCLKATSKSGTTFYYDNSQGGFAAVC